MLGAVITAMQTICLQYSLLTIQTVYLQYRQFTHSTDSLCVDLKQFDSRCCDNSNAVLYLPYNNYRQSTCSKAKSLRCFYQSAHKERYFVTR